MDARPPLDPPARSRPGEWRHRNPPGQVLAQHDFRYDAYQAPSPPAGVPYPRPVHRFGTVLIRVAITAEGLAWKRFLGNEIPLGQGDGLWRRERRAPWYLAGELDRYERAAYRAGEDLDEIFKAVAERLVMLPQRHSRKRQVLPVNRPAGLHKRLTTGGFLPGHPQLIPRGGQDG